MSLHIGFTLRCACVLLVFATCTAAASDVSSADREPPGALAQHLAEAERLAATGDEAGSSALLAEAERLAQGDDSAQDDVQRARAHIAFSRGDYDTARRLQLVLLQRAEQRQDLPAIATIERDLGLLDRRQSNFASSQQHLERALELYRRLEHLDAIADTLTHLGLTQFNQGAYPEALEAFNESRRLQKEGARAEPDRTHHYLGLLYAGLGEYGIALEHLNQALELAHELPDPARTAAVLGSLSRVASQSGDWQRALEAADQALHLNDRTPGRVFSYLERGRALLHLDRRDEARAALETGAAMAERIGQHGTLADYRAVLAQLAVSEGRDADALALWEQALPAYQDGEGRIHLLAIYRAMVPVLKRQGQTERALELAMQSMQLQEQLSSLAITRRLAVAEIEIKLREDERRIELLERDNQINALRLMEAEARRSRALWLSACLAVIALLLAVRYLESRRMQRRLSEANRELLTHREALTNAHTELEQRAGQLAKAAATDPLTGLANRREFLSRFAGYWSAARTQGGDLSLALIDADHFKSINDAHGHAAGDAALRALGKTLQQALRQDTLLARWGGEEFIVALPSAGSEAAAALAERLRQAVESQRFEGLPAMTISIGIANLAGRALERPEILFDEADKALYRAKALGRNRVCVADVARPA